jgi:hypothetical protein
MRERERAQLDFFFLISLPPPTHPVVIHRLNDLPSVIFRFMLGIGNPLVGPSAVDAVVAGCVYINPTYTQPVKDVYMSQHPYLADRVGAPHVCSAPLGDAEGMANCATQAISQEVQPIIPNELTESAYSGRVKQIFGPYVSGNA